MKTIRFRKKKYELDDAEYKSLLIVAEEFSTSMYAKTALRRLLRWLETPGGNRNWHDDWYKDGRIVKLDLGAGSLDGLSGGPYIWSEVKSFNPQFKDLECLSVECHFELETIDLEGTPNLKILYCESFLEVKNPPSGLTIRPGYS